MPSATALDAMLQVIWSLLFFVAAYLTLALCTILGLVIAELISDRESVLRAYGAKPALGFPRPEAHKCKRDHLRPRSYPKGMDKWLPIQ